MYKSLTEELKRLECQNTSVTLDQHKDINNKTVNAYYNGLLTMKQTQRIYNRIVAL